MQRTLMRTAGLLAIAAVAVSAQETREPDRRTVRVRGGGSVTAVPDQVRLSVQIATRGASASEAMEEATKRTAAVLALLTSYGVEKRDIATARVNVTPVLDYERRIQPPPIAGYTGTNELSVLFRQKQMERIGEFLDQAVSEAAARFGPLQYESSRRRELEREALAAAAEDARARAEALAKPLGTSPGRVVSISEIPLQPRFAGRVQSMEFEQAAAPVMPGELTITATADVVFELR